MKVTIIAYGSGVILDIIDSVDSITGDANGIYLWKDNQYKDKVVAAFPRSERFPVYARQWKEGDKIVTPPTMDEVNKSLEKIAAQYFGAQGVDPTKIPGGIHNPTLKR